MSANRNNDLPVIISLLHHCEIHPESHYNKNKSAESRYWRIFNGI